MRRAKEKADQAEYIIFVDSDFFLKVNVKIMVQSGRQEKEMTGSSRSLQNIFDLE